MSTTGRTVEDAPPASDVADALAGASFVRIVARADGDALAASGVLARALGARGTAYQISLVRTDSERDESIRASDPESLPISIGSATDDAVSIPGSNEAASVRAFDVAQAYGATPDPVLALAGAVAAGVRRGTDARSPLFEIAREGGHVERRPGVGIPTADLADGLAHTTHVRAEFSGDVTAAGAAIEPLDVSPDAEPDIDAHRAVASLVALTAVGSDETPPRAADAIERALRPVATPSGVFETVGGYADVLDAAARERPGTGVALALGHDARDPALAAWRSHAIAAHDLLNAAATSRYDGLFVARADAETDNPPVETAARLLRDFHSPEPVALVVADDAAGLAADGIDLRPVVRTALDEVDGAGSVTPGGGYARIDDPTAFTAAVREAL